MNCAEEVTCMTRFQRHLADYLFANGYPKSALKLARDRPELSELCLTELFEEAVQIEDALYRGDTGPAHNWIQEANFKLKKSESYFEFDLRVFEFYLLVREGKRMEAIHLVGGVSAKKSLSRGSIEVPIDNLRLKAPPEGAVLLAAFL
ncbi:unnamed protein product [Echinostoma caproni]|uniref:CTLH domain-containing protein n=1 Tax=Echinostoma caproni TaxID=27848 RepID=A0A183B822_9TREM|nr:unnamed protein product [Echinostoma caproni]